MISLDQFEKKLEETFLKDDHIFLDFLSENLERVLKDEPLQLKILVEKGKKLREFVIQNTSSENVLAMAARDFYSFNRVLVSEKTRNKKTLSILSFDPDPWVRCSVAENPYIPKEVFRKLIFDISLIVRLSASKNISIWDHTDIIKEFLEKRGDYSLRIELLDKSFLPSEIFQYILKNQNCPYLIKKALSHCNLPEKFKNPYSIINLSDRKEINELEKMIITMIATTENFRE